jgi:hypothetical protein
LRDFRQELDIVHLNDFNRPAALGIPTNFSRYDNLFPPKLAHHVFLAGAQPADNLLVKQFIVQDEAPAPAALKGFDRAAHFPE